MSYPPLTQFPPATHVKAPSSAHLSTHPVRESVSLAPLTSVVGVFVCLGARPPVVLLDVALPALTAVAAHGVDTDVRTQGLVAGGTLVDIWVGTKGRRHSVSKNSLPTRQAARVPAPLCLSAEHTPPDLSPPGTQPEAGHQSDRGTAGSVTAGTTDRGWGWGSCSRLPLPRQWLEQTLAPSPVPRHTRQKPALNPLQVPPTRRVPCG